MSLTHQPLSWLSRLVEVLMPPNASDVLGMNRRNVELVIPRNPREHFSIANNKLLAKRQLSAAGVQVAETLTTFESFSEVSDVEGRLAGLSEFVIKPAHGSGGRGIMVIKGREGADFITVSDRRVTPAMMKRHIADLVYGVYSLDRADVAIVEPLLKAHPWFKGLFEGGLSDVRVIVIDDQAALAMIRVPTRASDGRANLHQGGIGLGVDLQTGRVTRALWRGRPLTLHPDSQAPLVGELVPHWPEIVALAEEASRAVPLNYLGVDLVVDEQRGPLVLEINVRPGLEIQNVTGVALRRRLKVLLNHTSEVRS